MYLAGTVASYVMGGGRQKLHLSSSLLATGKRLRAPANFRTGEDAGDCRELFGGKEEIVGGVGHANFLADMRGVAA